MKIAYVLDEYPSLTETFIAREIAALRRRGIEIDVWAMRAGEGASQIPSLPAVQFLGKISQKYSASARQQYWRRVGVHWAHSCKEQLNDVQHIHAGWSSHPTWIAWSAAELLGVPWSFSGHARDIWVENAGLKEKLAAAKFASCCTRAGADKLTSMAPAAEEKVLYAPHGIEFSNYDFVADRRVHAPIRLLAVGRLVEKKGFADLMLALPSLKQYQRYQFQLTIIGDGPDKNSLQRRARDYGISASVEFAGALPHRQVIDVMQQADLFIMPSVTGSDGDRDGLPNVLLEAAACGLPIVATRAGAIEDFLDESCAWLWPRNYLANSELIGRAIELYHQSLQKAHEARARVEQHFDVDKNIEVLARAFLS